MGVNPFDAVLLVLVGVLVLLGLLKGLTRLLIGVAAIIAAFLLATQFHGQVATSIEPLADIPEAAANLVAYLVIFVGTMLAGAVLAYALRRLLKAAMLGWADRLGGGAVGLVAGLLAAALVILPVVAFAPSGETVLRNSVLAPYVTVVADIANHLVPEQLSAQYRQRMESLRQYWRQRVESSDPQAL